MRYACSGRSSFLPQYGDNVQVFKDLTYKRLETLLKAYFALASSALQPAVAAINVCQSLKVCIKLSGEKEPSTCGG